MGGTCGRLWVARDSNGLSLFYQHDFSFPVGVEIFYGRGCFMGIRAPITEIAWHLLPWSIRFDFLVICLAGIKAPNLLPFQTSLVVVALVIF
uniref:Uncharacterized protein n=1 Tax=Fagus sylvatica TaxID=28930 RepID=A0A2N9E1M9_FAGSY